MILFTSPDYSIFLRPFSYPDAFCFLRIQVKNRMLLRKVIPSGKELGHKNPRRR